MKKILSMVFLTFTVLSSCKKDEPTQTKVQGQSKDLLSYLKSASYEDSDAYISLISSRTYSLIEGQTVDDTYLQCILKPSDSLQTFDWNGVTTERTEGWNFYRSFYGESTSNILGVSGNFVGAGGNFPSFSIPFEAPKSMEISVTGVNATNQATIPVNGSVTISWIPDITSDRLVVIMGLNAAPVANPLQIQKLVSESTGFVTFTSSDLQALGGQGAEVNFAIGRGNETVETVSGKKIYILGVSYVMTTGASIE